MSKKGIYCTTCGSIYHYKSFCSRNRKPIKTVSDKARTQQAIMRDLWFENNPPDKNGYWPCYLQIHPQCPIKVDIKTLNLEHVRSKARAPSMKFDYNNIKPSCRYCNAQKGSKDLDQL